ncbi:MAG: cbb3-type cytochrome oxidase assembly protein CcoS [Campylobacter sp.]|nr:cbb3-type cytochrome oxidase assembly protein CcoS [Campylobacter sp.]
MDTGVLAMMLFVSIMLGAFGLFGVIWGIKNHQFEDYRKFLDGTKYDDEDALNEAAKLEQRKKETLAKKSSQAYGPPD